MCFWLPFSCPEALVRTKFISATFYHCVSRWSGRWTASSPDRSRSKTDGVLLRERLQRTKVGVYIIKSRFYKSCILGWGAGGGQECLQLSWCVNWRAGHSSLQWVAGEKTYLSPEARKQRVVSPHGNPWTFLFIWSPAKPWWRGAC